MTQADAAVKVAEQQLALAKAPATEQDLKQARSAVAAAEAQLALVKQPITEYDLKAAQAGVDGAKAALDLTKVQLAETTVKAPFDGVVSQKSVAEGAMVGPTAPILTLISTANEVVISVDEATLGQVKPDQAATVLVSAFPGVEFKAAVSNVAPSIDPKTRTATVRLAPQDPDAKLKDGMFAQVTLTR
jgi:RND family efflux transporter MFP subunit